MDKKNQYSCKQYDLFESIEKPATIESINNQIKACQRCVLHKTRKHALTGEGNLNARIMFVALSPGIKEDAQNRMFIGPSGQVLNKLLQAAGIERELVFMTNLVKCMLPKNRKPKQVEIESCSQFLDEEITIIHPEVIVPLGYYATQSILTKFNSDPQAPTQSFAEIKGKLLLVADKKIFPLPHPAALLYNPSFEPGTIEKYKKMKTLL